MARDAAPQGLDQAPAGRYEGGMPPGWLENLAAYRRGGRTADACLAREKAAIYQCTYLGQES
jgi:hypothetical protein